MTQTGSFSCQSVKQFHPVVLCNLYTICRPGFGRLYPMLTAKTQYNLTNAREYFEEHLCVGDYYDEGQPCPASGSGWPLNNLACPAKFARMISCGFVRTRIQRQARH